MNAKEIRALAAQPIDDTNKAETQLAFTLLAEIAAQLAQLNEGLEWPPSTGDDDDCPLD